MGGRTKYYITAEVAEILGCSKSKIAELMRNGELKGYKASNGWHILMDQPEAFESVRKSLAVEAKRDVSGISSEPEADEYIKYVEDDEHSSELFSRLRYVKKSISISTANLKNLYVPVEGSDEKVPFFKFLEDLVKKGVTVNLLYSHISSVLYDEKDKYPDLMKSENFHPRSCGMVHMKMFIFDEKEVYIGSANLTNAAIGKRVKKTKNFEAGIITNNKEVVERAVKHFHKAWDKDCPNCPLWDNCFYKDQL